VGICLQHDCLFPQLTVTEHVQFFSRVKGLYEKKSKEEAEKSVTAAIEDVALLEKKNTYSKDLSGGMKRKLSVAIAFCGDSNVVFLDEPTRSVPPKPLHHLDDTFQYIILTHMWSPVAWTRSLAASHGT
jgi:ABC-type multidrug transport system ATPase subunit